MDLPLLVKNDHKTHIPVVTQSALCLTTFPILTYLITGKLTIKFIEYKYFVHKLI